MKENKTRIAVLRRNNEGEIVFLLDENEIFPRLFSNELEAISYIMTNENLRISEVKEYCKFVKIISKFAVMNQVKKYVNTDECNDNRLSSEVLFSGYNEDSNQALCVDSIDFMVVEEK